MVEIKYLLSRHVDCNDHRGMTNRCTYIRIIINLNKQSLWNQDKSRQDKINHKTVKPKKAPANSQSRHLKSPSSTMKTTTSSIQKIQEKNCSHIRRFSFSQTRHLKHGSLITCSPEQISQSRRLHRFPDSTPNLSRTRHLTFPVFVTFPLLYIITKYRIYDNTLSQNL
jgi:hypothetical protein